jgi:hypothetical protein
MDVSPDRQRLLEEILDVCCAMVVRQGKTGGVLCHSIETGDVDFILPLDRIADKLSEPVAACGGACENNVLRP